MREESGVGCRVAVLAAVCMWPAMAAQGEMLFSKPGGPAGLGSAQPSDINSNGTYGTSIFAEDFTLSQPGTVDSIHFWGRNTQASPLSFISAFRVRFFVDNGSGLPGALLSEQNIPAFQVTAVSDPAPGMPQAHRFEATLLPVAIGPNTRHWVSIAAVKTFTSSTPIWSWQHSGIDDGMQLALQGSPTGAWSYLSGFEQGVCVTLFGTLEECALDVNGDGIVDTADLGLVLGAFGTTGPGLAADVNGDGVVDTADLGLVLGAFGGDGCK